MEEIAIIKESEKRLNKLKLLDNFFNDSLIVSISVRTRVIHDIFAANETSDKNKLELFHLQYTDSLIDVLKKLKKKNEQLYTIYNNEISINNELIIDYQKRIDKDIFLDKIKTHNLIMQDFMASIYQDLAFENKVSALINLKKNELSEELGLEYFRKISEENYQKFIQYPRKSSYQLLDFEIEKKLLGKLNIQNFKFKLCCGFQFNGLFIEVYEFIHNNDYFVYLHQTKQFFLININDFNNLDFSRNKSNKKDIILQLKDKNEQLIKWSKQQLKLIPIDLEQILKDYLNKINTEEFLGNLICINEETNILKTMININIK